MVPDVQFLSKFPILGHGTTEMRCVQPSQYLESCGWSVSVGCVYRNMPCAARAIVFHRLSGDKMGRRAIELARAQGLYLFYDVDDLIFDQGSSTHLSKFTSRTDVEESIEGYRDAMMLCDTVLCSTRYLAERARKFHSNVIVMKNGLSREFIDIGSSGASGFHVGIRPTTLGYFSGSSHHDDDFALIQGALQNVMQEFPETRLILAGKLEYDSSFLEFGNRFEHRPFMPYAQFMRLPGEVDINLVPLVASDPFAQARSELKYIEAAAFGVPTIASPTSTYKEAIIHGETGLIATDDDWYRQLSALIRDAGLRQRLGSAAREDVLKNYSPDKRKADWSDLMETIPGPLVGPEEPRWPIHKTTAQRVDIGRRAVRRWIKKLSN